jgi:hypothetical protein
MAEGKNRRAKSSRSIQTQQMLLGQGAGSKLWNFGETMNNGF